MGGRGVQRIVGSGGRWGWTWDESLASLELRNDMLPFCQPVLPTPGRTPFVSQVSSPNRISAMAWQLRSASRSHTLLNRYPVRGPQINPSLPCPLQCKVGPSHVICPPVLAAKRRKRHACPHPSGQITADHAFGTRPARPHAALRSSSSTTSAVLGDLNSNRSDITLQPG